jgi:thiol-disulfide isomerase/thioredoxin
VLWQLEFQLTPASAHDALRARVRADVAKLHALKSDCEDRRWAAIRQGYTLIGDAAGRRALEAELLRAVPNSRTAADTILEQWETDNPHPNVAAPIDEFNAHMAKEGEVAKVWAERWPNYAPAFRSLLSLMSLDSLPADRVAAVGRQIWGFVQRNPDCTLGFTDAPVEILADRLLTANAALDIVPAVLEKARADGKARIASDLAAVTRPMPEPMIIANNQVRNFGIRKSSIILQIRNGKPDAARAELEALQKDVLASAEGSNPFWRGTTDVLEVALTGKFLPIARDTISHMSAALDPEAAAATTVPLKRQHAMHETSYWEFRARLAKLEGRNADSAAFYLRALDANPRDFDPVGHSRLVALSEAAWVALGGTSEGLSAYRLESAASSQWTTIGRKMPDFALQDTAGRSIRLGDLAGKTVFINVWATWCGPCQGELPWVERLYQAAKDRKDVVVLTFNVDDNPGIVAQYAQEHQYHFPVVLARSFVDDVMKVEGIPRNWIIDPAGMLRLERQAGFNDSFVKDALDTMAQASKN